MDTSTEFPKASGDSKQHRESNPTESLRSGDRQLDQILQTMVDGLVMVDLSGQIIYANRGAERVLGIKKEAILGRYYNSREWRQIDEHGQPYPLDQLPLAVVLREQREVEALEHAIISPDGEKKWLSVNAAPLFDERGQLYGAVASFRDITAHKHMEQTAKWLATFPERNPNPVVEVDSTGLIIYSNTAARRSFPDLLTGGPQHPWIAGLDKLDISALTDGMSTLHRDVKVGDLYYQQAVSYVLESQHFRIYGLDITERVQAEQALKKAHASLEQRVQERTQELEYLNEVFRKEIDEHHQSLAQLHIQTTALEAAANGILITDHSGTILWSNPALTQMTGYTGEEMRGHNPRMLRSGNHDQTFYKGLWETILSGQVWRGEIVNRRKDGSLYTEENIITPVRDEKGDISNFIAIKQDVTERKRAEELIRRANAYNRSLIEVSLDPLVTITLEGKIGDVNTATELVTGYSRKELIGTDFSSYFTDPERASAGYQQVFEAGIVRDYELEIRHKDGHITPVFYNAAVYYDEAGEVSGVFAAARDITERKLAEQQIRENARRIQVVAEVSNALTEVGPDFQGVLDAFSARLADLIGDICIIRLLSDDGQLLSPVSLHSNVHDNEEAIRTLLTSVSHRVDEGMTGHVIKTGQALRINDGFTGDNQYIDKPEYLDALQLTPIHSVMVIPLRQPGRIIGTVSLTRTNPGHPYTDEDQTIVQNLTDRAALAIANARLYHDLQNALEKEKSTRVQLIQSEKFAAIGRMVGSITHEINNPLQTIKNCLYLTQEDIPVDSHIQEYLGMATSEVQRLSNLVAQLRELYRPRSGGPKQPHDLLDILEGVHSLLIPHLQNQKVQWESLPGLKNISVNCVEDQIKQVFLNISMNAIEAMQPEGGKLFLDMVMSPPSDQVGVVFRDTGPGITPEISANLFEPFVTTKSSGLGLGLSICYEIIQRHGGRITVDSQPGQGSVFTVWLSLGIEQ